MNIKTGNTTGRPVKTDLQGSVCFGCTD